MPRLKHLTVIYLNHNNLQHIPRLPAPGSEISLQHIFLGKNSFSEASFYA